MALAYLAASCIAAFAVALVISINTGSILLGVLTYSGVGTLSLCLVLVAAMLRNRDAAKDVDQATVIPAE